MVLGLVRVLAILLSAVLELSLDTAVKILGLGKVLFIYFLIVGSICRFETSWLQWKLPYMFSHYCTKLHNVEHITDGTCSLQCIGV